MKIVPFYYLSLMDQVAQLFYDRDFVNKLIRRSTAQKDVIGSSTGSRWFTKFMASLKEFQALYPNEICIPLAGQLYFDEFGLTDKKRCGGLYFSFCNLPYHVTHEENYRLCLGFAPHGVSLLHCLGGHKGIDNLMGFIKDFRILERGAKVFSAVHGKEVVTFSRLMNGIADFPAAQVMAGALGVSALHPCRFCIKACKGHFGDWTLGKNKPAPTKGKMWLLQKIQEYLQLLNGKEVGYKGKVEQLLKDAGVAGCIL